MIIPTIYDLRDRSQAGILESYLGVDAYKKIAAKMPDKPWQLAVIAADEKDIHAAVFLAIDAEIGGCAHIVELIESGDDEIIFALINDAKDLAIQAQAELIVIVDELAQRYETSWWNRAGFHRDDHGGYHARTGVIVDVDTAAKMKALGMALAEYVQPADVIIATGELGSGKTTFAQGLGCGLGVDDIICSPTFVLSRIHQGSQMTMIHVDAYRLASAAELDDIDLDESVADSLTFIEWGEGLAEQLSNQRLDIRIVRSASSDDDTRQVSFSPVGRRWDQMNWNHLIDSYERIVSQQEAES